MSGLRFVADTNFLINVHEGKSITEPFLDGTVIISIISEIELLGWTGLTTLEKMKLKGMLDDCIIIDLNPDIKDIAIELKQKYAIKTPDAIIAATSKFMQLPLVTSDKGFRKLKAIQIILI